MIAWNASTPTRLPKTASTGAPRSKKTVPAVRAVRVASAPPPRPLPSSVTRAGKPSGPQAPASAQLRPPPPPRRPAPRGRAPARRRVATGRRRRPPAPPPARRPRAPPAVTRASALRAARSSRDARFARPLDLVARRRHLVVGEELRQ